MRNHRDIIHNADAKAVEKAKAFQALADAQREHPEIAMLRVQHAMGGGVLNYCVEHVGDLTHRMADAIDYIPYYGYDMVVPKVERALRMLSSRFIDRPTQISGFAGEHAENVRNNAKYYGITPEEFEARIEAPLRKYAEEHAKLYVYNDAQYWAREAAIALGEGKFGEARRNLEFLMGHLGTPEAWAEYAGQYNPAYEQRRMTARRPQLTEAPISHVELQGPDSYDVRSGTGKPQSFDKGTGFSKVDQDILTSKKGMTKVVRAFKNTPHNFEVFFINTDIVDGDSEIDNEDVDAKARKVGAGVKRQYGDIDGKAGVIRVVVLGNLSPMSQGKMPMTGWTLAHKIGHSLQDECYNSGWQTLWAEPVTKIVMLLNQIGGDHPVNGVGGPMFQMHPNVKKILTMKSARDKKLKNDFEVFAEVVAQYLVAGKVTIPSVDQELVERLNYLLSHMFEELEGSVLLEV